MPRPRNPRRDLLRVIQEIRRLTSEVTGVWDVSSTVDDGSGQRPRAANEYPENRAAVVQAAIADMLRIQHLAAAGVRGLELERARLETGAPSQQPARGPRRNATRRRMDALQTAIDKHDGDTAPMDLPPDLREGLIRAHYIGLDGKVTTRGRTMVAWVFAQHPAPEPLPPAPGMCNRHPAFEADYCPGCGTVPSLGGTQ